MFIVMFRTRAVNAPLQMPTATTHLTRDAAEIEATRMAKVNTSYDYFVFEAQSQHSARIEVDVKKP
jgi:hypothetical protein